MTGYIDGLSTRARAMLNRLPTIDQLGKELQQMEMSAKAKAAVAGMTGLLKHYIVWCAGETHTVDRLLGLVKDFSRLAYSQIEQTEENLWTIGAGAAMLLCAETKYLQFNPQEETKQTKDYIRIALKIAGYGALAYSILNTVSKLGEAKMQLGLLTNELNSRRVVLL